MYGGKHAKILPDAPDQKQRCAIFILYSSRLSRGDPAGTDGIPRSSEGREEYDSDGNYPRSSDFSSVCPEPVEGWQKNLRFTITPA
jgi:hypothetical protein